MSFFISHPLLADDVFISISYYDGLGKKFRVETASSWPNCQESKKAQKIYLHELNELREIALWRKNGKMEGAGGSNLGNLIHEVNAIFAGAKDDENPCFKKPQLGTHDAEATLQ